MALTDIELRKIHQNGTAVPNRRYASLDGTTYIGLANGRLQKRDVGLINLENEEEMDDILKKQTLVSKVKMKTINIKPSVLNTIHGVAIIVHKIIG